MKREYDLLPIYELYIVGIYKNKNNRRVILEAGTKGWTVVYEDGTVAYKDINASKEENFASAYITAEDVLGKLREIYYRDLEELIKK